MFAGLKSRWRQVVRISVRTQVLLFGVLFALTFDGLILVNLVQTRANLFEAAVKETQGLARIYQAYAEHSLNNLDMLLRELSGIDRHQPGIDLTPTLLRKRVLEPHILDIAILDPAGRVRWWTGQGVAPDVFDRPYYTWHRQPTHSEPFLDSPKLSRVHAGKWFVSLSRHLTSEEGGFDGVAVVMVDLDYFAAGFRTILDTPHATVLVAHADGTVALRLPETPDQRGRTLDFGRPIGSDTPSAWTHQRISPIDQLERIASFRKVGDYPLYVAVSHRTAPVLREWGRTSVVGIVLGLAVTLFAVLGSVRLADTLDKRERTIRLLGQSRGRVSRQLAFQQALLDAVPIPISVRDAEGLFIRCNQAFLDWIDAKPEAVIGQSVASIFDPEVAQAFNTGFDDLIASGGSRHFEMNWPDAQGRPRHVEIFRTVHLGPQGKPDAVISATIDLTQRLRWEAELKRSNADLEQFSYAISHDLQEPLRMIASYIQLLDRRYGERFDDDGRSFVAFAVDGAKRLQGMINGLLDYSRVTRKGHEFALVDLGQAARMALDNLQTAIDESGAVIELDALPTILADRDQMLRLFQNLIGNAFKYRDPERPPRIAVRALRETDAWVIAIADNGIGIAPKQIGRLFQVFQRLHPRNRHAGGYGIGLALCRRIVERHGGAIWVESEGEGKGSTFRFRLPDRPDEAGE